ncbi:HEPN domain-containing protein [Yeosuana sp. AK3]
MGTKAKEHFITAQEKLNEAKQELFRPEEDIVSFLVCKNSQHAIENYLKGYLLKNGVDVEDCLTIDSLYNQCLVINKNFEKVDLSDFQCKGHDINSRYCTEIPKVSNCFDAADNLDTFLRKEKIL